MNHEAFILRLAPLMPAFGQALTQWEANDLSKGKLTLPQFWALHRLQQHGPCTMSSLARELNLKGSTTTLLVSGLERHGYAVRAHGTEDRRVVKVHATPAGKRLLLRLEADRRSSLAHLFSCFTAEEREQYLHLMEKTVGGIRAGKEHKE
jgi:DNA-binding MarR family transcriptional regulator